jgi:hypothetical protein
VLKSKQKNLLRDCKTLPKIPEIPSRNWVIKNIILVMPAVTVPVWDDENPGAIIFTNQGANTKTKIEIRIRQKV